MHTHNFFITAAAIFVVVMFIANLTGCTTVPGTPCAGHFMCFN